MLLIVCFEVISCRDPRPGYLFPTRLGLQDRMFPIPRLHTVGQSDWGEALFLVDPKRLGHVGPAAAMSESQAIDAVIFGNGLDPVTRTPCRVCFLERGSFPEILLPEV